MSLCIEKTLNSQLFEIYVKNYNRKVEKPRKFLSLTAPKNTKTGFALICSFMPVVLQDSFTEPDLKLLYLGFEEGS